VKNILLLFSILFTCVSTYAQPERISLWPGLAPGTEGRKNTEAIDAAGSFSQVFQPELTYFPALNQAAIAPAILVCPGGGYRNVVIEKEGVRIAQWFQQRGFAVFVLKYRLAPNEALQDARRAMRVIRARAAQYRIDPAKISVVGFSAGGHLSANLAVNYVVSDVADEIDEVSARPDFCAPIYGVFEPGIKNALTPETPPMFLAHAVDDNRVPVEQSLNLFAALKAKGIPAELHLYETGGHGFALEPDRGHATSWAETFLLWLKAHGVEAKPAEKF
jgi:acetyl esterase/lipase